jgi:hypothetical protein
MPDSINWMNSRANALDMSGLSSTTPEQVNTFHSNAAHEAPSSIEAACESIDNAGDAFPAADSEILEHPPRLVEMESL